MSLQESTWLRAALREIGRGTHGARALDAETAARLWSGLLDGALPESVVGAVLMAFRFKGETSDELGALLDACAARAAPLAVAGPLVVMPCYNGGKRLPNMTWLTARALRAAGMRVLLHGVRADPGRVTTFEVATAAGLDAASDVPSAARALARDGLAFLPIDAWCPALAALLERRRVLGLRNSGHTVCKLMHPAVDADRMLMLVPVTHVDYVPRALSVLQGRVHDALVFRGVDGEPALYPHAPRTLWRLHDGLVDELQLSPDLAPDPALDPDRGALAGDVAAWTDEVISGDRPMPAMTGRLVALARSILSDHDETRA